MGHVLLGHPVERAGQQSLCASCPLYKRERAAPVGPPPLLSLGRLKFNSGTATRRCCQIVPCSFVCSLARSLLLSPPSVIERSIYTASAAREDFRRGDITVYSGDFARKIWHDAKLGKNTSTVWLIVSGETAVR